MTTLCENCEKEITKLGSYWFHVGESLETGMNCNLVATPEFESLIREMESHKKACDCFNDVECAERVKWLWVEINNALDSPRKSVE